MATVETTAVQFRRGTNEANQAFKGAEGEVVVNTDHKSLHVHDDVHIGGYELARADMDNITNDGYTALSQTYLKTNLSNITSNTVNPSTVQSTLISDYNLALNTLSNVTTQTIADKGIAKSDLSNVDPSAISGLGFAKADMSNVDTANLATSSSGHSGNNLAYANGTNIDTTELASASHTAGNPLAYADLSNVTDAGFERTANKDANINPTSITSGHYPSTSAVKNYVETYTQFKSYKDDDIIYHKLFQSNSVSVTDNTTKFTFTITLPANYDDNITEGDVIFTNGGYIGNFEVTNVTPTTVSFEETEARVSKNVIAAQSPVITIAADHWFTDETARDAYFVLNPSELVDGMFTAVGGDPLSTSLTDNEWLVSQYNLAETTWNYIRITPTVSSIYFAKFENYNTENYPSTKALITYVYSASNDMSVSWGNILGNISNQTDLQTALNAKQGTLTAGTLIGISNNTISFTGTLPTKISDLTDDTAIHPIDKADTLTGLTATSTELNVLDGITATTAELNYTDGVTSNIQTQLNSKQATLTAGTLLDITNNTISFTGTLPTKVSDLTNDSNFQTQTQVETKIKDIQAITAKTYASTVSLNTNTINTITLTGNVTFSLPTPTDTTILNQIQVQLYMASVYTIALGTTTYFNGTAPDLSTAGSYNIIYEYDNLRSVWVVGAILKAAA